MRSSLAKIRRRDVAVAAAVIAFGAFGIAESLSYRLGELRNIGPGAFPFIVSALIVLSGILIAAEGLFQNGPEGDEIPEGAPNWRVLIFITTALLSFAAITPEFGVVPGIVVCVFIAAQADGSLRLWQTGLLAVLIAGFCAVVFVVLLKLPLELVDW